MTEERIKEYEICTNRGHTPQEVGFMDSHYWRICKFCQTRYRIETTEKLVEKNRPTDPIPPLRPKPKDG